MLHHTFQIAAPSVIFFFFLNEIVLNDVSSFPKQSLEEQKIDIIPCHITTNLISKIARCRMAFRPNNKINITAVWISDHVVVLTGSPGT